MSLQFLLVSLPCREATRFFFPWQGTTANPSLSFFFLFVDAFGHGWHRRESHRRIFCLGWHVDSMVTARGGEVPPPRYFPAQVVRQVHSEAPLGRSTGATFFGGMGSTWSLGLGAQHFQRRQDGEAPVFTMNGGGVPGFQYRKNRRRSILQRATVAE